MVLVANTQWIQTTAAPRTVVCQLSIIRLLHYSVNKEGVIGLPVCESCDLQATIYRNLEGLQSDGWFKVINSIVHRILNLNLGLFKLRNLAKSRLLYADTVSSFDSFQSKIADVSLMVLAIFSKLSW